MSKKKIIAIVIMMVMIVGAAVETNTDFSKAATSNVKKACVAALKKTGNVKKIGYKSSTASDFDAISYKYNKKVSSFFFVTSDNTAYTICVAKAKSVNDAKKIYNAFSKYKYDKIHGTYFKTDYTKTEQSIIQNAIYGRKGKYIWYISMASKKKNLNGEKALKKKL